MEQPTWDPNNVGWEGLQALYRRIGITAVDFPNWIKTHYGAAYTVVPGSVFAQYKFPNKSSYMEFCLKWL